jgi:THO complex subunit 2
LLAAILIWEGLVDLPSLWPHVRQVPLSPANTDMVLMIFYQLTPRSDEDFSKLKDTYKDEISDRIAAARSNALSMAGVLMDEEVPPPASKGMSTLTIAGSASLGTPAAGSAPAAEVPADPPNARLGLLRALLSIGAFKQAYWILSTYSWICEPVPEMADLLLRLLSVSICIPVLDQEEYRGNQDRESLSTTAAVFCSGQKKCASAVTLIRYLR